MTQLVPGRSFRSSLARRSPFVVEVERHLETPVKVTGTAAWPMALPVSTLFGMEIINASCYRKVNMPAIDL